MFGPGNAKICKLLLTHLIKIIKQIRGELFLQGSQGLENRADRYL